MKALRLALLALPLAGCTDPQMRAAFGLPPVEAEAAAPQTPLAAAPPAGARTAEEFDTTTAEDRAAALAPAPAAAEERLGTTIASLGPPADPGIWISTPLVSAVTWGRAEVAGTGKSINLELRPSGGVAGSGSQISLPAMRLMEIPLTDLPELVLYRLPGGAPA